MITLPAGIAVVLMVYYYNRRSNRARTAPLRRLIASQPVFHTLKNRPTPQSHALKSNKVSD